MLYMLSVTIKLTVLNVLMLCVMLNVVYAARYSNSNMLNVLMLYVIMLNVIILFAIMLNVVMQCVIMLNVAAPTVIIR
jgi:hypothetical protein